MIVSGILELIEGQWETIGTDVFIAIVLALAFAIVYSNASNLLVIVKFYSFISRERFQTH